MPMLYLLKTIDYYKIGYSSEKNIKKRMEHYATENPYVELLGVKEGTTKDESEYHRSFSQYEGTGEWYKVPESIIDVIKEDFTPSDLLKRHKKRNGRGYDKQYYYYYKRKRGQVIQINPMGEEIGRFNSITEAANKTGFNYTKIRDCVIGKIESYKGCNWVIEKN